MFGILHADKSFGEAETNKTQLSLSTDIGLEGGPKPNSKPTQFKGAHMAMAQPRSCQVSNLHIAMISCRSISSSTAFPPLNGLVVERSGSTKGNLIQIRIHPSIHPHIPQFPLEAF